MNITHTLNADSIKQAVLKVDENCVYDIYYFCNSTGVKHAVGMLGAFARPRIAINSITMRMNNPDWANMVTLSACDRRDGEQRLVSIATTDQLKKIQENPLVGLNEITCTVPESMTFLVPSTIEGVAMWTHGHNNVILAPKTANSIVDAVGRILFDFDNEAGSVLRAQLNQPSFQA